MIRSRYTLYGGHGGQVILTKDAADALIPRIHKVDALLESIGTFRIPMDKGKELDVELLDCQPLPTPRHPHRNFSKYLRKIEYVAPGRSLAVIPPPPALAANRRVFEAMAAAGDGARYTGEELFIVVIRAEESAAAEPELVNALAGGATHVPQKKRIQ